jgi:hypothetical protein
MEPEQSVESLSYETVDERNRRGCDVPKKRLNKKELRERKEQIEKRSNQREGFLSQKAEEEASRRLQELNEELRVQKRREEETKRQALLAHKEEQRLLFQQAMIHDALGEAPSSEEAKKKESYDQRKQALQQDLKGRGTQQKPGAGNRAALLKSLAANFTS